MNTETHANEHNPGWYYLAISIVGSASIHIVGHMAQETLSLFAFMVWFYAFGAVMIFATVALRRRLHMIRIAKKGVPWFVAGCIIDAVSVICYLYAVHIVPPSLMGLLYPLATVFPIIGGAVFLKEPITRRFLIGSVIALAGLFMLRANADVVYVAGIWFMIGANALLAVFQVIIKHAMRKGYFEAEAIAPVRVIVMLVISLILATSTGQLRLPQGVEWGYMVMLGFFGPVGNAYFLFSAIRHLPVSTVTLLRMLTSLVIVLVSGVFFFVLPDKGVFTLPTPLQLAGGAVVLFGAVFAVRSERTRHKPVPEELP